MKKKLILLSAGVIVFVAVAFTLKDNQAKVRENVYRPDPGKKVLVKANVVSRQTVEESFVYTGSFAPYREIMLSPQAHGEVDAVYFEEGDIVKQGKLLVQIDDDLLRAQFDAANANYLNAKRSLDRYDNASRSGGVSQLQLDNLELNLTTAKAQRDQLSKQIELCKIVAPFSGTITKRDVERGSVVGGAPVARITDLSQLKLALSIPEKEIAMFSNEAKIEVSTDVFPGETVTGVIDYVSDRADDAHNYAVNILVKNDKSNMTLKAGMYGSAKLERSNDLDALLIPRTALIGSSKRPQVFVAEDGVAVLKDITTGALRGEAVEVLDGLKDGDAVIVTGHINLANGTRIEIVK